MKPKLVTLLSLRSPFLDDSKVYPPLSNLYLKSYIEKHTNHKVIVIDDDYNFEDKSWIDQSDVIGLSIMTPQRHEAWEVARQIKYHKPEITLIGGGPHVKHYHEDMIRTDEGSKFFDFLIPRDGEKPLVKILNEEWHSKILIDDMSKQEIINAPRPDRTSINSRFLLERYSYTLAGRNATTLMTARGCPEKCTFCEDAETGIRWSGIDTLTEEMNDISDLGYKGVYIFDDLFAIAMPKVKPIVRELSKRDLVFRCNGQARYFTRKDEEFAKLLSDNGCVEIAFGFESGSQEILDNVQKRTTIKQNYDSVAYAKKHGIRVKGFMMLGLPGENWDTINETEKFIRDSGIDDFQLAIYMPYKGTQIRKAMDTGESIDLKMIVAEASGAYGIKGGGSPVEVRTSALSAKDLESARDYLITRYKPHSHTTAMKDAFFETHEVTSTDYEIEEVTLNQKKYTVSFDGAEFNDPGEFRDYEGGEV
jgi:anaerobic magnesium-protoporphyrin IX monomethyl ester cyclase